MIDRGAAYDAMADAYTAYGEDNTLYERPGPIALLPFLFFGLTKAACV